MISDEDVVIVRPCFIRFHVHNSTENCSLSFPRIRNRLWRLPLQSLPERPRHHYKSLSPKHSRLSSQHQLLPRYPQSPFLQQGPQHLNHLYLSDRYAFPQLFRLKLHSHFAQPNPSRGFAAFAGSTSPFASFNKSQSPLKN